MNARSQIIELAVEGRQIEEVVQSIFHTILLHRTTGKYIYNKEKNFTIGHVKVQDTDCDFLDFSYVKLASPEMDTYLKREIAQFKDMLRSCDGQHSGQISLEFYRKHKARWLFQADSSPWEVWNVKLDVISLNNEHESSEFKTKLSEQMSEKIFGILDVINRHEFVPRVPVREEEDTVFDTSYSDIQPYLFKIHHQTTGPSPSSVKATMGKFFRGMTF